MKRLALAVVVVLALVAGGLALTGRGPFAPGGVLSGGGTPPPGATIAPVPESDAVVSDGEVVPLHSAALGASVAGRVITVTTEGTPVAAGDVVLRLDPAQADAAVALAAAALP